MNYQIADSVFELQARARLRTRCLAEMEAIRRRVLRTLSVIVGCACVSGLLFCVYGDANLFVLFLQGGLIVFLHRNTQNLLKREQLRLRLLDEAAS